MDLSKSCTPTRDEILLKIYERLGHIIEKLDQKAVVNDPPKSIDKPETISQKMNIYITGALGYSGVDQAGKTPDKLLEYLDTEFHFTFDPCPVDPAFDGLSIPWGKTNYVNPPYNDIAQWVTKALLERDTRGATSVLLIPFRPHTKYFRQLMLENADEIRFFRHKFAFKGYKRASLAVTVVVIRPLQLPLIIKEQHDRRLNILNITETGPRTAHNVVSIISGFFSFERIDLDPTNVDVVSETHSHLVLTNSHPEAFIDRAVTVFDQHRKTIALILPLRVESSYFLDKILFGSASHAVAISPTFAMSGFDHPSPTGSVLLVWSDTPCESLYRTSGFRVSVIEENFHRTQTESIMK